MMQRALIPARNPLRMAQLSSLASCVLSAFAMVSPAAASTVWTVSDCTDGSPAPTGSLRQIIDNNARSNDTVNLTACSVITINQGAIGIPQGNLTLQGPGSADLILSGLFEKDRVLKHLGGGTLTLIGLSVEFGYKASATAAVNGGCIYSNGTLSLSDVVVRSCNAKATGMTNRANGGGLFANNIELQASTVTASTAYSTADAGYSAGGGIWVSGSFSASASTISGNSALSGAGIYSLGLGNTSIVNSTISGNHALAYVVNSRAATGGGVAVVSPSINGYQLSISDSTISGNTSENFDGGVLAVSVATVTVQNSTIAFNREYSNQLAHAAGLTVATASGMVRLESSILSNNVNSTLGTGYDFAVTGATVSGANNIVDVSNANVTGIAINECPLLGALRNNGGPTQTHALLSTSPALATGNNAANLPYDQRGRGYPRTSTGAFGLIFTDMGAYETQRADIIFNASFDGCP